MRKEDGNLGAASLVWTEERIAELRRLWDLGLSGAEIGRRLGVSKCSAIGKAHRLKLPGRPSPIRKQARTHPTRRRAAAVRLPPARVRQENAARPVTEKPPTPRAAAESEPPPNPSRFEPKRGRGAHHGAIPIGMARRLAALGPPPKTCQFIDDEPSARDECKCGANCVLGHPWPYCEAHMAKVIEPRQPESRKRRKRRARAEAA